ncbi:helix-turn-helix transcriptional regulator [Photorhabdus aegyptia]
MSNGYAEKLKLIRKAEGLTKVAFAKELGLGLRTVKNYETGHIPYGFQDASRRQGSESPGA